MAQPQVIINQAGGLPISAEVMTGSVGPATLIVSGSAWSPDSNKLIGVDVLLDGTSVGQAVIYSNEPSEHRALVTMHLPIELDKPFTGDPPTEPPTYTVELAALNADTNADQNDWFQVVLLG